MAEVETPVVFHIQPRAAAQITLTDPQLDADPAMTLRGYHDMYGNPCTRVVLPAGRSRSATRRWRTCRTRPRTSTEARPRCPGDLPDDILMYTLPSRYCLPDMLGDEAWSRFGAMPPGYRRVQAICDHVNDHLTFQYGSSDPTSTAVRREQRPASASAATSPTWPSRSAGR